MQAFRRDTSYFIASHSFSISLIATVFWTPASGTCKTEELMAFTMDRNIYVSQGFRLRSGYFSNKTCQVLVRAAYDEDIVKITIKEANLELRGSTCVDKVILYDGSSPMDVVLGEFCGTEKPSYQSTGHTVLVSYSINSKNSRLPKGFKMEYYSLDRGGYEAYKSSKSISVGTIVGIVVTAVIVYCLIFICVYRHCKRRATQSSGNNSSATADLGVTTLNLLESTNQQALNHKHKSSNGHHKQNSKNSKLSNGTPNGQKKTHRMRHPAGDLKCGEKPHPPTHINTFIIHEDGCSGYCSEWEESGYVNDCPGVEHHYIHINNSLMTHDPTGVYYAGSIDEDGVLHPPGEEFYLPVAPAPTVVSSVHSQNHFSQLQEEDRRSRGSLHSRRSPFPCGRDSPSSGRGSPFRNRMNSASLLHSGSPRFPGFFDPEGQTLTYYGMIDGVGSDADAPPYPGLSEHIDNVSNEGDNNLAVPPPSYEDAATGKYSPVFVKR
uniref:CUB domain-containing protein n=1 Tax=Biomphalaria glabrata TaxID=6526 RepID=A0A2C9LPI9_BIOGL